MYCSSESIAIHGKCRSPELAEGCGNGSLLCPVSSSTPGTHLRRTVDSCERPGHTVLYQANPML